MSDFLINSKYGCHCLPKLFVLNLPIYRVLIVKFNVQESFFMQNVVEQTQNEMNLNCQYKIGQIW
jgi:hypothetical protein